MDKKKIVFLGSKPVGFQCFQYLLAQCQLLNIEVIGLLSRARSEFGSGSDLYALAAEYHVPVIQNLDDLPECDILYSVQYHEILKPHHIAMARQVAVNLHMAPLPEYRGSNQFTFALLDGKKEFGTTIHILDEGIDNGDILFQKRFPIPDGCWVNELYEITFTESVKLFRYTLGHIISGKYQRLPQQELISKYGGNFHARKEMNDAKVIDLAWDKDRI